MRLLVRSFVRSVAGETITVELGSGDTVANLKAKICQQEGIVPSLQRLVYLGKELKDDQRMQSFTEGIVDMSVRRYSDADSSFSVAAGLQSKERGVLRGYFFHPTTIKPGVKRYSVVRPVHRFPLRYSGVDGPRDLSLDKHLPVEACGYQAMDCHLGLLVLQRSADEGLPAFVVWDPASGDFACLPPPPADALMQNGALLNTGSSENLGGIIVSRKEGESLDFQMAYVSMEVEGTSYFSGLLKPRVWVATYNGETCNWEPTESSSITEIYCPPIDMDRHCVRVNGKILWHRQGGLHFESLVSLNPTNMTFSEVMVPGTNLEGNLRLGEDSNGRLMVARVGQHERLYVCKQLKVKNAWTWSPLTLTPTGLSEALDKIPSIGNRNRRVTQMTDFDPGYPQSVIIKTSGNGKFRYHIGTGKLERLVTTDGLEWGHPIFPYYL